MFSIVILRTIDIYENNKKPNSYFNNPLYFKWMWGV